MMTTRKKIQENPERIQQLVDAHVKSTKNLNENKEQWLKAASEFGTKQTVLNVAKDNMELIYDIDEDYIEHVKALAVRMKEQGLIQKVPEIERLFDLSFLNETKQRDD